jgi:hypothetical protein
MERAFAHGYLRTKVKGYWDRRERTYRQHRDGPPTRTGPNLSGWKRLAAMFEKSGNLQRGGERLVAA